MAYSGRFSTLSRASSTNFLSLLPDSSVYAAAPIPIARPVDNTSPTNPRILPLCRILHYTLYSTRVTMKHIPRTSRTRSVPRGNDGNRCPLLQARCGKICRFSGKDLSSDFGHFRENDGVVQGKTSNGVQRPHPFLTSRNLSGTSDLGTQSGDSSFCVEIPTLPILTATLDLHHFFQIARGIRFDLTVDDILFSPLVLSRSNSRSRQ